MSWSEAIWVPCYMDFSITAWYLASPEWDVEGVGESKSKLEVSLCNLILEVTSHHSCHVQVKLLGSAHPQREGTPKVLTPRNGRYFRAMLGAQPQEPQINDPWYRKLQVLEKNTNITFKVCSHLFILFIILGTSVSSVSRFYSLKDFE